MGAGLRSKRPVSRQHPTSTHKTPSPAPQAYVTYDNTIEGMLPYMIALDRTKQAIVLAVRGSMSVADVVTGARCGWCRCC
jgi:hypothetical protein